MEGVRRILIGALGNGLVVAAGLSLAFLALLALTSPLVAAAVAVPASVAAGVARARRVPLATPHSLTAPSFGDGAVVTNAFRAAAVASTSRSASSAA
jgi:hypothetical protein